jgi:hypothetical protein
MTENLDDCGINFAALQHGAENQAHADLGSDDNVWVNPLEAAQDAGKIGACRVFSEPEQKSSGERRFGQAQQRLIVQPEDAAGIVQEILARRREHRSSRFSSEKLAVEADFESFDFMAYGRLGETQCGGGSGNAAMVADCAKRPHSVDFQTATIQLDHGPLRPIATETNLSRTF